MGQHTSNTHLHGYNDDFLSQIDQESQKAEAMSSSSSSSSSSSQDEFGMQANIQTYPS